MFPKKIKTSIEGEKEGWEGGRKYTKALIDTFF